MVDISGKEREDDAALILHAAFLDDMNGAVYAQIGPSACIPFLRARSTRKLGVLRFVSIFTGLRSSKPRPSSEGPPCGSNSVVVVAHDHYQRRLVQKYFDGKDLSGADLEDKVNSRVF